MKDSQAYPMPFCRHVFNEWKSQDAKNVRSLNRQELASSSESEGYASNPSDWSDCEPDVITSDLSKIWIEQGPGFKLDF